MYINFVNDRKDLGYSCLIDSQCGNRLVLITDSSVVSVKNITLKGKRKAERIFIYGMLLFQLSQPLVPYVPAVILPLPTAIERLSPFEQDRILNNKNSYLQIAHIFGEKIDKIQLTDDQIKEFNNLAIELNSGSITMEEAILQLIGGDVLSYVVTVILFVTFINWYDS